MPISQTPEIACRAKPPISPMRGSMRPMKMARKKPMVAPTPRAAMISPISASGKPACCCSSGGSSTIGVKFSMP